MDQKFLNARSPLRLLEKGLHGGLGAGNLGIVLAGHGVGKTSFLVGVAMDELLRKGRVLHVSLSHTVSHAPLTQRSPGPQGSKHEPQWKGSASRLAHHAPHAV